MDLNEENGKRVAGTRVDAEVTLRPRKDGDADANIRYFDEHEVRAIEALPNFLVLEKHPRWWVDRQVCDAVRIRRLW